MVRDGQTDRQTDGQAGEISQRTEGNITGMKNKWNRPGICNLSSLGLTGLAAAKKKYFFYDLKKRRRILKEQENKTFCAPVELTLTGYFIFLSLAPTSDGKMKIFNPSQNYFQHHQSGSNPVADLRLAAWPRVLASSGTSTLIKLSKGN